MSLDNSKISRRDYFYDIIIGLIIAALLSFPVFLDLLILYPVLIAGALASMYLIKNDFELNILHFAYVLIFFAILAPPLKISSSLPLIRIDEILIYLFCPLILLTTKSKQSFHSSANTYIKIYLLFLGIFIISTLYGKYIKDVPVGRRDYFEFVTSIKYLLVFLSFSKISISKVQFKKLLYFILLLISTSGIFGLLQYYSVFGFDTLTAPLYLQERLHIFDNRVTGTFKNPNTFSSVLLIGHIISLSFFLTTKNIIEKYINFIAIILLVVLLLFAGSRTVLFIYFFITIVLLLLGVLTSGVSKKQITFLIAFLSIGFILSISFLSYEIILRLQSGLDILGDESFGLRILVWYFNFQIFLESPIIGWGPAKDLHPLVVDNEYLLILRRHGIIGLLIFLGIYLFPLKVAVQNFWHNKVAPYYLDLIILFIIVSFGIANITNSMFFSSQVMDFWMVLLGLYFAHLKSDDSYAELS